VGTATALYVPQVESKAAAVEGKSADRTEDGSSPPAGVEALPAGCVLRIGTARLRVPADFAGVVWSADAKLLAVTERSGALTVLDAKTGDRVRRFPGPHWPGSLLLQSGDKLLLAEKGIVRSVDMRTGKEKLLADLGLAHGRTISFAPDGKTLLVIADDVTHRGEFRDWTRPEWRRPFQLPATVPVNHTHFFARDGKVAVFWNGSRNYASVDVATGAVREISLAHIAGSWPLFLHPDGKRLYVMTDSDLVLVDLATGKELARHAGPFGNGFRVIAPDGKELFFAAQDQGKPILVLDGLTLQEKRSIRVPASAWAGWLSPAPDGKTLGYLDGSLYRLVDPVTGKLRVAGVDVGHHSPVRQFDVDRAGKRLLSRDDLCTLRLTNLSSGKEIGAFTPVEVLGALRSCAAYLSPDGALVAVEGDGGKRLLGWDVSARKKVELGKLPAQAKVVGFSAAGRLWLATDKGNLDEVDPRTGAVVRSLTLTGVAAVPSRLTADGSVVVALTRWGKAGIHVWRPLQGGFRTVYPLNDPQGPGGGGFQRERRATALSPDGRFLAFTRQHGYAVDVLDLTTNKRLSPPRVGGPYTPGHPELVVQALAFTPDGKRLALGLSDGSVRWWASDTAQELFCSDLKNGGVSALTFTPAGKQLIVGGQDTTITVWDVATLEALAAKARH
jgi:WD40 repeat protein